MDICRECGVCCLNTEMELSSEDISIIEKSMGKNKSYFCQFIDGIWQLKNIEGHCIFLKPNEDHKCIIYPFRPKGCKFYPLMYDSKQNKCVKDMECPHNVEFFINRTEMRSNCRKLTKWVKKNFSDVLS